MTGAATAPPAASPTGSNAPGASKSCGRSMKRGWKPSCAANASLIVSASLRNRPLIMSNRWRGTPNTTTPCSTPIGCACCTAARSGAFSPSSTFGHASITSSGSNDSGAEVDDAASVVARLAGRSAVRARARSAFAARRRARGAASALVPSVTRPTPARTRPEPRPRCRGARRGAGTGGAAPPAAELAFESFDAFEQRLDAACAPRGARCARPRPRARGAGRRRSARGCRRSPDRGSRSRAPRAALPIACASAASLVASSAGPS